AASTRHFTTVLFVIDSASLQIYTLSLHDALPILPLPRKAKLRPSPPITRPPIFTSAPTAPKLTSSSFAAAEVSRSRSRAVNVRKDRKSTRLNSSHQIISYAVFCLKQKTTNSKHIA